MKIEEYEGDDYSQISYQTKPDVNDPRVGGTTIIFDSRLDEVVKDSETNKIRAFMKVKQESLEYKPKPTELDKQKEILQSMIEE